MAILQPAPRRFAAASELARANELTPIHGDADELAIQPPSGFFEAMWAATGNSLVGAGVKRGVYEAGAFFGGLPDEPDPAFDPMELFTPEFVQQYPFIIEEYESGRVFEVPNRAAFDYYLHFKDKDFQNRLVMARGGFVANTAGSLGPDLPLMLVGGSLLRGTKLAADAATFYRTGTLAQRVAKLSAVGFVTNGLYEAAVKAVDPANTDDGAEATLMAALQGAAIGAAIPLFAPVVRLAGRTAGRLVPTPVIERIQKQVELAHNQKLARKVTDLIDSDLDALRSELEGPVQAGRVLQVLRHPTLDPVVDQIRRSYADAGAHLEIQPHPAQAEVDWLLGLEELDKAVTNVNRLEGVKGKLAESMSFLLPEARVRKSASDAARTLYPILFDSAFATHGTPSAESIARYLNNLAGSLKVDLDDLHIRHFREGSRQPYSLTLSDGTAVEIDRRNRLGFGRVVKDLLMQEDHVKRGMRSRLSFDPPAAVKQAAERYRGYTRQMLTELEEAGLLQGPKALKRAESELQELEAELASKESLIARDRSGGLGHDPDTGEVLDTPGPAARPPVRLEERIRGLREEVKAKEQEVKLIGSRIERADSYVTRRWLAEEVKNNERLFKERLVVQFRRNREVDFDTGTALELEERPVISGAVQRLSEEDRSAIAELTQEQEIFELDDALWERYNNAVDDYFTGSVDAVFDVLADVENAHGVQAAFKGGSPLDARILQIDEGEFRQFLDNDLYRLIDYYNHAVGGRAGLALALKRAMPKVKGLFNDLVGPSKPGEKRRLDETLVIEALRRDFQRKLTAAGAVDAIAGTDIQKLVGRSEKQTLDVFQAGVEQLFRRHNIPTSLSADVAWRAGGRILMRMPYMAFGGGFLFSSLSDLAAVTMLTGATPGKLRTIGRALIPFKEFPRIGLEVFDATADEAATRSLSLFDIDDMPLDPRLATTAKGRLLARADQVTDLMARKVSVFNGMNWWNRNLRRASARMMIQNAVTVARHFARGGDVDRAIGREVADFWRRSGMTKGRARELLDVLHEHGRDLNGQPVTDVDAYKGFINPNYSQWHGDHRELFEWFTTTVDRNIRNVVIEPNILSRPLINRHVLGRMFNQFWAFAFAWANQSLPVAAQHSSMRFAGFLSVATGMGALADAIKAHLSGQRSFEDTGRLWVHQPHAMMAMAVNRAGITSWLARPLEILNRTPFGYADQIGSTLHIGQARNVSGLIGGSTVDLLDRFGYGALGPVLQGRTPDAQELHTLRTIMPYQNLWFLRAIYRFTHDAGLDNPFGPGKGLDLYPLPTTPVQELTRSGRSAAP